MRVVSYNIHKGIGGRDRRYRLERIVDVIEQQNPDVICLQEVDRHVRRSRFHDQPGLLADYFKATEVLYQINVRLKTGGYGNLILSRWPLRRQHQISLRFDNKKPRGAQLAVIDTPEGLFHLVHWHLGLSEQERHYQVRRVLTHRLFHESADLPTLILGDCNDWRNTLAKEILEKYGFHPVTHPVSRFRTFPAYWAVGALDKAFYRGQLTIRHARIVRSRLARRASDHLPLVIDLHLGHPRLQNLLESEA